MIDFIDKIDRIIFLFFNGINAEWLDPIMKSISAFWFWYPIIAIFIILSVIYYKKKFWIPILFAIICFALTDLGSNFAKNNIKRHRPSHNVEINEEVHIVDNYRGGKFGFFSGHAANSFGLAFISLLFIRKKYYTYFILFWAALVSYSRVYIGVHFPGDIFVGALYGTIIAFLIYKIYQSIPFFQKQVKSVL